MSKNQHITPRKNGWAVIGEGAEHASSIHPTQAEAIERGRKIARNNGGELLIHGRDGRIRDRDSYGNDFYPPRG